MFCVLSLCVSFSLPEYIKIWERERETTPKPTILYKEKDQRLANQTLNTKRAPCHHQYLSVSQGREGTSQPLISLSISLALPLGVVGSWYPSPPGSPAVVTVRSVCVVVFFLRLLRFSWCSLPAACEENYKRIIF